eukprot:TRINITY_DN253_c0_g3_i1.p1 TRINITY_DN253_c0_g3~~TRINITY_DN253_c0_g3_i1.p1  ORF type:complete len:426 (+),score=97.82 TRINITY_DN253_c0_g3_i1:59-1279(+)
MQAVSTIVFFGFCGLVVCTNDTTVPEEVAPVNGTEPVEAPEWNNTMPVEEPAESPEANVTTPASEPIEAPTTPAYEPAEEPSDNSTVPALSPDETPDDSNKTTPSAEPVEAPQEVPDSNATVPHEAPESNSTTPINVPVVVPETVPIMPPVAPDGVKWCTTNVPCTLFGDTTATCNTATNECKCGQGYGPVAQGNVTAYLCVKPGSIISLVIKIVLSLVFNIDCNLFDVSQHGALMRQLIKDTTGGDVEELTTYCGSLVVVTEVGNVNPVKLAGLDVTSTANQQLNGPKFASLRSVVGTVASSSTDVGGSACKAPNAATTTQLPSGACAPVRCNKEYTLRKGVCVAETATASFTLTLPISTDSSDSLSAGVVVGIVIGSIVFIGAVGAAVFFCWFKKTPVSPLENN